MIMEIEDVLDGAHLAKLTQLAGQMQFVDGRSSNAGFSEKVNLQGDPSDAHATEVAKIVSTALRASRQFCDFAIPRRMMPPMLARYTVGMKYGPHADAALLAGPQGPLRSDVSTTVFLNPPDTYEGGELVLHLGARSVAIKLKAGAAVVYASTTLHEVAPVRSGERLVAITFIESLVPDEYDREVLFELGEVSALEGDKIHWANRMRLEVVRQNLTRRWSGR